MKTATFRADAYLFLKPGHPSSPHETESIIMPATPDLLINLGPRLLFDACNSTGIRMVRQAAKLRERFW
jgi:hypothetical protein